MHGGRPSRENTHPVVRGVTRQINQHVDAVCSQLCEHRIVIDAGNRNPVIDEGFYAGGNVVPPRVGGIDKQFDARAVVACKQLLDEIADRVP